MSYSSIWLVDTNYYGHENTSALFKNTYFFSPIIWDILGEKYLADNVPTIPKSVKNISDTFGYCHSLVTVPVIPNGVVNMNDAFIGCKALKTAPIIPNSVNDVHGTFHTCTSRKGTIKKVIKENETIKPILCDLTGGSANLLNKKMNASDNIADRICWELTMQQAFFTRDKSFIAECIRTFLKENSKYGISPKCGISYLETDTYVNQFNEVAQAIENIDENKFPFFIFKNSSCDDGVERLFVGEFNEDLDSSEKRSLRELKDYELEFIEIKNKESIPEINFISNLDYFS